MSNDTLAQPFLVVPYANVKDAIFDQVLNSVLREAKKMMQECKPDTLVLAGGFGSNPYLMSRLKSECKLPGLVKTIIRPKAAYAAVMEGMCCLAMWSASL